MTRPTADMLGAEGVSRGLVRMLRDRVNVHLQRQRDLTGETVRGLPDVHHDHVYATPRPFADLGTFPCLMVSLEATDGRATNRVDHVTGAYDELVMVYRASVYVWATGPTYHLAQLALQRYVLAVRGALITGRVIGDPEDGDAWAQVELSRLQETYADPEQQAQGTGWVAGGWVSAGLTSHERVYTDDAWAGMASVTRAAVEVTTPPSVTVETTPVDAPHPAELDNGPQW